MKWRLVLVLWLGLYVVSVVAKGRILSIHANGSLPESAQFGLSVIKESLRARGQCSDLSDIPEIEIHLGLSSGSGQIVKRLQEAEAVVPEEPESFTIQTLAGNEKLTVVICGADERGLLYGLLDVAEQCRWQSLGENRSPNVVSKHEAPFLQDRGISMYTMHRKYFEQRLHDEAYWESYFSLLARSRINNFIIIFGYENGGFMAPLYPFFFDVKGFGEVRLNNITQEEQHRNTLAFNRLIELAHAHGVQVTPAIWDHIYRGHVQAGGIDVESQSKGHLVAGITADNLIAYNKAALLKFLEVFPDIDGLQFRMHGESGLSKEEIPRFWHDIFAHVKTHRPDLRIDLRAKGLPDEVIDDAVAQELDFRVATKYWMEQMGLPYHPLHVVPRNQKDRRHGYADLLRYPRKYDIHWRMWNGGTVRCLLWSNPEYVRRFVESARLYDGKSFEVNEMMATWMLGEDHETEPRTLLNEAYQVGDYPFERYWPYYQVWGRVSYNPKISNDAWLNLFNERFGETSGGHLMEGIHLASQVLPRIVASAYRYRYFPTTRGWVEMMAPEELPAFAMAENSDVQLFQTFANAAEMLLGGGKTVQYTPILNSHWFREISGKILSAVEMAEASQAGDPSPEFITTLTDLKILANLALYYAERIPAAVHYNMYLQSGHPDALKSAINGERKALEAWEAIVDAAGDVYSRNIAFGAVNFPRHWADELVVLQASIDNLESEYQRATELPVPDRPDLPAFAYPADSSPPLVTIEPPEKAFPFRPLKIVATIADPDGVPSVVLRYRHLTQFEDYLALDMKHDPATGKWTAIIPAEFIVPEWDLILFLEVTDGDGHGAMFPDFEKEAPYVVVGLQRDPDD